MMIICLCYINKTVLVYFTDVNQTSSIYSWMGEVISPTFQILD